MIPIERILLSRMKYIGDIVLTTPVIRATREAFPQAYIAYLGEKSAVSLLEHNPCLDEIIPYDFSRWDVIEQPRMMLNLRRRKFDAVVDFFSNPRTALLTYATGAPTRIGKKVKGRGGLYTIQIEDDGKQRTAIEFHYRYVEPLGVKPTHFRPEIFLTDDERREAKIFLKWQDVSAEKPVIGLHPGATWPAKMWDWERFADLADMLIAKLGCEVVVTQGPGDREVVEKISKRCVGSIKILPVLPLRQLAAVLSHLSAYVANDNGTMHIAVAVGAKTIGIFGPGEEEIWFPYVSREIYPSNDHRALRKDVSCHPCHLDFCNRSGDGYMECMKLLTVGEVLRDVQDLIQKG